MKLITEKSSKVLIITGILLLFFGLIIFVINSNYSTNSEIDTTKFSQFGDYFGGVIGAIWSLAGVILFYVALDEQRKDIKINQQALIKQIEEFELQRTELEETRKVFKEQSETFKIQRFENTFFQMVNLYNEITTNLQSAFGSEKYEKRDVLRNYAVQLSQNFDNYLKSYKSDEFGGYIFDNEIEPTKLQDIENLVHEIYQNFHFKLTKQQLSNYFRTVYHIFKFIYKSNLLYKQDKQFYANIIRAQLSSDELFLIFYNSIQDGLGYPNFLYLINQFDILQNFDFSLIEKYQFHHDLYKKKIEQLGDINL